MPGTSAIAQKYRDDLCEEILHAMNIQALWLFDRAEAFVPHITCALVYETGPAVQQHCSYP